MAEDIKAGLRLGSEPAAPVHELARAAGCVAIHLGMSKRELIAAMVMQGLCGAIAMELNDDQLRDFSSCCVRMADSLLQELARV